jgi:pimeloyl-ACP methyl ester carboxylesterase
MAFNQLPFLPERSMDRLVPKLWRDWSPGYDGRADAADCLAALPDRAHRRAAINYYRHLARPLRVPRRYRRWQAAISDLPVRPLRYLHGRGDTCLTPDFAEIARTHLPEQCDVRVVDGAGHFLQLEQPDEVNRLVVEFLGR